MLLKVRHTMLIIALLIVIPVIAFVATLTILQTGYILPAKVNSVEKPDPALGADYLTLTTPDGATLHGILFAPKSGPVKTLLLAFPGNTHNPIGFATYLRTTVFPQPDIAIASFSYRGYPNGITPASTGTPSQKAMYADSLLIYDTLTARLHPTQTKVVGYSIGTAVSTYLATQRKLASLALVAPIASVRRITQEKYPWIPVRLLLRHPFAVEDILAQVQCPTTIIYSPTDGLIPERHVTQILHAANPTIPLIAVPNTSHNTLVLSPQLPALLRKAIQE